MSNPPLPCVSICIPVFNGENFIRDSIESVLGQSYTDFELLIIDNCSTDSTQTIIESIKDSRIRYTRNKVNIGAINNFSKCTREARGEYFVLLPHDDTLLPGALDKFVKVLEDKTIGLAYSAIRVIDANGTKLYTKKNHEDSKKFTCEEAILDIVENFMPIQLAMVRTSILKQLGGFDIEFSLFSDVHLWLRVIFENWESFYINEPVSCHRSHDQQGQNAFLKPNLDILSEHWGKRLDKSFWEKNSYNYLFLKLSRFLLLEMGTHEYNTSHVEKVFLMMFIRSHLRSLFLSLTSLNGFMLWQEIMMITPLAKQYGIGKIFLYYPLVILNEITKKLSSK